VQFKQEPNAGGKPLFCDCSSDFLSRPLDMSKYALLYAGAQKNVGPAGVAVAIVRDDLLEQVPENLPSLLDYKLMAENDSLYNTPPCFAIYMIGKTTQYLLNEFGTLDKVHEHNENKAGLIYNAIDNSGGFYKGHAHKGCRSNMNVTFVLENKDLESTFIQEATAQGLDGLKGHRSVGGCRASIYNAMTVEGCKALADFMADFQKRNG
jgi:phosphoserine aminotransferase